MSNPALLAERHTRRLPRPGLLALCAAYALPGLLGRDPWRNADLLAYAQMKGIAEGRIDWLVPTLGGVPTGDAAWLAHGLGALAIAALGPLTGPELAARLPFTLLLVLTMALVWYATFHLARTDNALPLPLAFGGQPAPVDYARAIADGALLALLATLGLLQLGHETTPELVQLFGVGLLLYGLAQAPWQFVLAALCVPLSLVVLSFSGAPAMALALGVGATAVCAGSAYPGVRRLAWVVGTATVLTAAAATAAEAWRWRVAPPDALGDWASLARQWLWFLWPAWPLALWTLWRWRAHWLHRHVSVPLVVTGVGLAANLLMGGSDRALLLALPGLAVLAAFALPTFRRSTSAAIDWFSVFFFTLAAAAIWVIYIAMQTGVPAKPAANVAKLATGFEPQVVWPAVALAGLGTMAWVGLVRWRTGRHREALWKSLALPAGGVALCWLLLMTLWLPLLDYARSMRVWIDRVAAVVPAGDCVSVQASPAVSVAALDQDGRWRVNAAPETPAGCAWQIRVSRQGAPAAPGPEWAWVADLRRPTDRDEVTSVFRRRP
ncbi:MAG: hypothetical protein ACOVQT_04720 [Rubrivivax sp.]